MNYQIVKDEAMLKSFIDWLPELEPNEKYYFCLFARNKYCKELTHIKSDKAQLKRFVTDKSRMFMKIKQLEVPLGCYMQREFPVPEEALALYMTPNPRNMMKATVNTMVKLAQSIRDQNIDMNCHQEALSEIQKAKSRTCYVDFDIDQKESGTLDTIKRLIDPLLDTPAKILETRGGYHVLIDPETVRVSEKNKWYNTIKIGLSADVTGDNMIPVPGCTQGGFIPHFVNL